MKNFSIAFLIFIVWSFIALWLYAGFTNKSVLDTVSENTTNRKDNLLIENKLVDAYSTETLISDNGLITNNTKEVLTNNTHITTSQGLQIKGVNHQLLFEYPAGISIVKNTNNIEIPSTIFKFKEDIVAYLSTHTNNEIHINSLYSPDENLNEPNLGAQRGEKIKELLINLGIPSTHILVNATIVDIPFDDDNQFKNAISFTIKELDNERIEDIAKSKDNIPKNITFYPLFTETGILKNNALVNTTNTVAKILKEHSHLNVKIIGHTDNAMDHNVNMVMGKKFATEVAWFFKKIGGIASNRIQIQSRGQTRPITSNYSAAGREANKRIELQFYINDTI